MTTVIINPYRFVVAGDPLLENLVSWWSFDETSGTRYDAHGSYDLTENASTGYVAGRVGNAAALSGPANWLNRAHHADFVIGNRDFTVAGWFKISSVATIKQIFGQGRVAGGSGNTGWALETVSGSPMGVRLRVRNVGDSADVLVSSVDPLSTATWYFVIIEYTADVLGLAIDNGTPVTGALTGGSFADTTMPMGVGNNVLITAQFTGNVDEWAVWHRLLTTDEKAQLYNSGAGMGYPG